MESIESLGEARAWKQGRVTCGRPWSGATRRDRSLYELARMATLCFAVFVLAMAGCTQVVSNRAPAALGAIPAPPPLDPGASPYQVDVAAYFSDPDGDSLTFAAESSDQKVATVSTAGSTLSVTPIAKGTATITVSATDPHNLSASQQFQVAVENRAPAALGAIPAPPPLDPGASPYQVDVAAYFNDPDGDPLTFAAESSDQDVATVSTAGSTLSVTPIAKGTATITVSATDPHNLSASQQFQVTVENRAPAAHGAIPAPPPLAAGASPYQVDVAAYFSDPDGDPLTYAAESSDQIVATVSTAGSTLSVTPAARGTAIITVSATDPHNLSASQQFQVTVENRAPTAHGVIPAPPPLDAGPSAYQVDVAAYFSDPDGTALTYSAESSDQNVATVGTAGSTLSVTPIAKGTATITVTATDRGGLSAAQQFQVTVTSGIASRYRGHGDQVFVLNPDGERLDNAVYTLHLGNATAEVYLIATNAANSDRSPEVERLEQREAAARGLQASGRDDHDPPPRPALSGPSSGREWITEFNNDPPLSGRSSVPRARLHTQSQQRSHRGFAEGDRFSFTDLDDDRNVVYIPATARRVVTDRSTTAVFWVADRDWGPNCAGAGPCVTGAMVDAMAERFLRPGAGNDIHDWVTAIFGSPWGRHRYSNLIPPGAAAAIHVLLFDIKGDGAPQPGECRIVGYFWAVHNFVRDPSDARFRVSAERLIFFMDSAFFAIPEGPTWEVTDRRPSSVIGTLAHEFQHMIHFYQKRVLRDTRSETWLNEMASEVAEDLVADKMMVRGPRGVAHDDPTAGEPGTRGGRLPIYNLFNDVQVTTWDRKIANYSINYAFGAYLARTYGGAELFSAIVQSGRSGIQAVEAALAALGHDVSFGQALADWAVATLLSDSTAAPAPYRYNPGTWITSRTGGEQFRLGSINLYHYRYEPPDPVPDCIGPELAGRAAQEGPYLHSLMTFSARTQPPHSNMYATLGRSTGAVRLVVNVAPDNPITVVVKE